MKKLIFPMALAILMIPGARAQSVFEGTWKIDVSSMKFPAKPFEQLLKGGMFSCNTCYVPYTVKADGTDQPVSGDPYVTTVAVKVVNDREIQRTGKKDGKIIFTATDIVSADGNTMESSSSTMVNSGPPIASKGTAKRVGQAPEGAHAISGAWRADKQEEISDNGALFTYKVKGDEITLTTPTGQSYTARMDGTEAPFIGDPGNTSVRVKLIGKDTLEESYLLDGKVVYVSTTVIGADGKRARITNVDKRQNTTTLVEAVKQE